jgi:hypothetical protein
LQLYTEAALVGSYDAWLGHFFSANLEPEDFLKYYKAAIIVVSFIDAAGSKILTRLSDTVKNKWPALFPSF